MAAEAVAAKELLDLAGDERELGEVSGCLQHLAVLQKAVHTYLDNKRRVFPRYESILFFAFFFGVFLYYGGLESIKERSPLWREERRGGKESNREEGSKEKRVWLRLNRN